MDPSGYDPRQDMYRRAALAAAIAVKGAYFSKGGGVAAAAVEAAISQGANQGEAVSIAVELERLIERFGPEGIASEEALAATVAAAVRAQGGSGDTPPPPPPINGGPQAPVVDGAALRRQLAHTSGWYPVRELAMALGLPDPRPLYAELEMMAREGFVRVENEHVYVTESGHRYMEYQSLR
jgi:hypothetical protein